MTLRTVTLSELRQLLTAKGYRAVSRESGVDPGTLHRFGAGRAIQSDTLKKVADALSVKVLID